MAKKKLENVSTTSEPILNESLEKLRAVFPQFVKDGEVDFDALKVFFDKEGLSAGPEKYGLSWAGKSNAIRALQAPATGTLVPQEKESVDWDKTQNIFIEGDNLEVLKLLQAQYRGAIKMIYIDPPYNTGKDFVYKDNFTEGVADYYERTGQSKDGINLTANLESNGRYHSDWLTMMYPRIFLAKNLLKDDGVIFISIDDNEVANLRFIMDEIFGENNFISQFVWAAGRKNDSRYVSISHEYILAYVRSESYLSKNKILWRERKRGIEDIYAAYEKLKKKHGDNLGKIEEGLSAWFSSLKPDHPARNHSHYSNVDERGVYFAADISWPGGGGPKYEVLHPVTKKPCSIPSRGWMFASPEKMREVIAENRVHFGPDETYVPCIKSYLYDREAQVPYSVFYQDGRAATKRLRELMGGDYFEHPKDETIIAALVEYISQNDRNGIYLDFFAGSGTTAHAVMAQNAEDGGNRKWICVQLPEVTDEDSEAYKAGYKTIVKIARERIRRAGKKIGKGDIGFKALALEQSNYRRWNTITDADDEKKLLAQEKLFTEKPLVDKYDERAAVYEVLLKEGFSLNAAVVQDKKVALKPWVVTDGERKLIVTFADKITKEQVDALKLSKGDLFVCLDSALDDTTKVNISRNLNVRVV
jgi:adenine-specific DNA-methyltransferase